MLFDPPSIDTVYSLDIFDKMQESLLYFEMKNGARNKIMSSLDRIVVSCRFHFRVCLVVIYST